MASVTVQYPGGKQRFYADVDVPVGRVFLDPATGERGRVVARHQS